jgi:hypothetical protein
MRVSARILIKVELKAPKTKDSTLYTFQGYHPWFPCQTRLQPLESMKRELKVQTDAVAEVPLRESTTTQLWWLKRHQVSQHKRPRYTESGRNRKQSENRKAILGCTVRGDPRQLQSPPKVHLKPAAVLGSGPSSVRREGEPARWPGRVLLRPDFDSTWFVSDPDSLVIDYHAGYDS